MIVPRHLRPHATFGDDPSGWCACAECEPHPTCECQVCRSARVGGGGGIDPVAPPQ